MQIFTSETKRSLYQSDYLAWYETTSEQVKNNQLNELDLESLSEVLENLVRDTKRSGESFLRQVMVHLLLIEYWQLESINHRHWAAEIINFRSELETDMTTNLKKYLDLVKENIYQKALRYVMTKTGLHKTIFPTQCPYTLEQLLDNDWFPNNINF